MSYSVDEGIRRAIECGAQLYNLKSNVRDGERDMELRHLYHLADIAPDGIAIECGVRHGGSLLCWAGARIGRGRIIANDTFYKPITSERRYNKFKARALANFARYPEVGVELLEIPASDAPAAIGKPVAFCFIDANHDVGGIDIDILTWKYAITPGGVLAFHDYGTHKGVVKQTVDEHIRLDDWIPAGCVGSLIGFVKK